MKMSCWIICISIYFFNSAVFAMESCSSINKEIDGFNAEITKMEALKEKNMRFYEEYKNDFSKKTKIFSNVMIINNKIELAKLNIEKSKEKLKWMGCPR